MRKNVLICLIFFIISIFLTVMPALAQGKAAQKTEILTPHQMRLDLNYFFRIMEEVHPNTCYRSSEKEYESYKKSCYEKCRNNLSVYDFAEIAKGVVVKFGDAHTDIYVPQRQDVKKTFIPFLTRLIEGKPIIYEVYPDSEIKNLKKGDIVLYIDDIPAEEYLASLAKEENYNNYNWRLKRVGDRLPWYLSFRNPKKVILADSKGKIYNYNFGYEPKPAEKQKLSNNKKEAQPDPFYFNFWDEFNAGYLRWDEMADPNNNFEALLQKAKETLLKNNTKYLIVDIRENGGGGYPRVLFFKYFFTSKDFNKNMDSEYKVSELRYNLIGNDSGFDKYLLKKYPPSLYPKGKYLIVKELEDNFRQYRKIEEKEKQNTAGNTVLPQKTENNPEFKGKIIVLISPMVFSGGEDFAIICRDNNLAVFIGEPTGGGVSRPGEFCRFVLPNSKIKGIVARDFYIRLDKSKIDEHAIYPDYYVYQTIDDFRAGRDTVLEFVKKGIRENKF